MKAATLFLMLMFWAQSASAFSYTLELSEAELQQKATALMPIEKSKFFITVILSDPLLDLIDGSNEIGLRCRVQIKAPGNIDETGSVELTGSLRYENDSGEFFFDNLTIVNLEIEKIPEKSRPKVTRLVETAAKKVLAVKPVYKFKDDKLKDKLAKAVLKSIEVRNETLLIELGVF